jgi:hypothetical protein
MYKTIKNVFLIILIAFIFLNCPAQNWPKVFGDNILALGDEVIENYDMGFMICGRIMKNGSQFKFGWLIKTDINGNILWNKKFGDASYENFFLDFEKTLDQGLVISGATAQYDIARDPLFIKTDPCGEIEWCKIFLSENMNHAKGVIQLPNGQYLGMLQYYGGDAQHIRISLVKMDELGEPIWIKHLAQQDSVANEEGMYLNFTTDSNYLVSGSCFSPSLKPYFIKTDTSGEELWNLKWPAGAGGFAGRSVSSLNGFIYNASHLKFSDNPKVPYLLKFTNSGEVIDQYPLMGDTIYNGGASSLLLYNDTTLIIGTSWIRYPSSFDGYSDILKTDTLGNEFLQRRLIDDSNPPTCILRSFNNKIVVIGYYNVDGNWDIYMWKMNENLEDDTLYTQPLTYDSLCPYEIQSDTVDLDCGVFVNIDELPTKEEYESMIKIYPNPAREWVALTLPDVVAEGAVDLRIYDIFGREAGTQGGREAGKQGGGEMVPVNRMILLNVADYPAGMYIAVARDKKGLRYTGKFVVAGK